MGDEPEVYSIPGGPHTFSSAPLSNSLTINASASGKPVLTLRSDGTAEIGEGFTPTEAGKVALDTIMQCYPMLLEQARKEEREACAKVADGHAVESGPGFQYDTDYLVCASDVAAAIRSRK